MCLVIDSNVSHELATAPPSRDAVPVIAWLKSRAGQLALGGKLTDELRKTQFRRLLLEFVRNGTAKIYPTAEVFAETRRLELLRACGSNDAHIVALARVAGCRLIFTRDQALQRDIKNKSLLDKPRGKVYSSYQTKDLLRACPACR